MCHIHFAKLAYYSSSAQSEHYASSEEKMPWDNNNSKYLHESTVFFLFLGVEYYHQSIAHPIMASALRGAIKVYTTKRQKTDIDFFLARKIGRMLRNLNENRHTQNCIKFNVSLQVKLSKFNVETGESMDINPWFPSNMKTCTPDEAKECIFQGYRELVQHFDSFVEGESGWTLKAVTQMEIKVFKYRPLQGGCKGSSLPPKLRSNKPIFQLIVTMTNAFYTPYWPIFTQCKLIRNEVHTMYLSFTH